MSQHAKYSPSGFFRYSKCTASLDIEAALPDQTSEASEQGTAAHELAEYRLRRALGEKVKKPKSKWHDEEMETLTGKYADYVLDVFEKAKENCADAQLLVEQKLDLTPLLPEGFGTADAVILADNTAHIIDLKYGRGVLVNAEGNPQMRIYALGMLYEYDGIYDISRVTTTVYQPRRGNVESDEISRDDLLKWAQEEVKPVVEKIESKQTEFVPGEWCRFCKIASTCRARTEKQLETAKVEFQNPDELSYDELMELLPKMDEVIEWAKAVQKKATDLALSKGKPPIGYKIVEGRTIRKYLDENQVIKRVTEAGYKDIWEKKLISVASMERALGKETFKEVLGDLVIKPEGKPKLVPEGDRRKPISIQTAKTDFKKE